MSRLPRWYQAMRGQYYILVLTIKLKYSQLYLLPLKQINAYLWVKIGRMIEEKEKKRRKRRCGLWFVYWTIYSKYMAQFRPK